MPFVIIGRTGPGMRQVVGFGDRDILGANLESAIVTNGDFTAYMCDSVATRPSIQITLGRLVYAIPIYVSIYVCLSTTFTHAAKLPAAAKYK